MKVIASENPLPLNDELKNALHISSDELKNIKQMCIRDRERPAILVQAQIASLSTLV